MNIYETDEYIAKFRAKEAAFKRYKQALEMIAGKRPCVEGLTSNVEIAREVLGIKPKLRDAMAESIAKQIEGR